MKSQSSTRFCRTPFLLHWIKNSDSRVLKDLPLLKTSEDHLRIGNIIERFYCLRIHNLWTTSARYSILREIPKGLIEDQSKVHDYWKPLESIIFVKNLFNSQMRIDLLSPCIQSTILPFYRILTSQKPIRKTTSTKNA